MQQTVMTNQHVTYVEFLSLLQEKLWPVYLALQPKMNQNKVYHVNPKHDKYDKPK